MPKQGDRRNSRATFVESKKDRVTFKMTNKESRKRCIIIGAYFAVFILGILIGLIPFIVQYVNDSEANRDTLRKFVLYQEKLYNFTAESPKFMALSARAKKMVIRKSASALSSKAIELSCGGKINITRVKWNGITGTVDTIKKFEKYCTNHMKKIGDVIICHVSMKLVYNWKQNNTNSFTEIDYNCEESL